MTINILIVDDDPNKCKVISDQLRRLDRGDIVSRTAANVAEARKALNENSFDVMFLDILLPARNDSVPSAENSIDFLRQIIEDQTSPAPSHIFGITADLPTANACRPKFAELTSQILHLDHTLDDWRTPIQRIVDHIRSNIDAKKSYEYDMVFQTALCTPELDAITSLPLPWSEEKSLSPGILFRTSEIEINGKLRRIACAHATQMGLVAATHLAQLLIREFRPRVLGMSGICGGVMPDVKIGDLIVAEKSWDWQSGKWDDEGELLSSVDQKDASADLIALTRGLAANIPEYYAQYGGSKPSEQPRLHIGPIVSGSSVVAYEKLHELFKRQHRKLIAVDMECYGVYFSSAMASEPAPKFLCVKAVSDLANVNKSDDFQKFCSYLSAKFLYATFERYFTQ